MQFLVPISPTTLRLTFQKFTLALFLSFILTVHANANLAARQGQTTTAPNACPSECGVIVGISTACSDVLCTCSAFAASVSICSNCLVSASQAALVATIAWGVRACASGSSSSVMTKGSVSGGNRSWGLRGVGGYDCVGCGHGGCFCVS